MYIGHGLVYIAHMATSQIYDRMVCKCEHCTHVWIAEVSESSICPNRACRSRKWNSVKAESSAIHGDILMPVIPEVAEQARKHVAGMCDHGREAKKCSYCARSRKLLNW